MKFADRELAKEIINKLYPNAKVVTFVENGYDNLVGLVDEQYALRFPRDENAYARTCYEKLVLLDLAPLTQVFIPKVLGEGENPFYVITTFLRGRHLNTKEIRELSVKQQRHLGENVASFAYAMHKLLSPEKVMESRKRFGLDQLKEEPWDIHFENNLVNNKLRDPKQAEISREYYEKWKYLKFTTPSVVIHDDLHNDNLMFENGELVGVIDFGDTNIGTPEQELRQLYRINDTVLEAAVWKYEKLSGFQLNLEASKTWAIVQELAIYSEMLFNNNTKHPAFSRATKNLNRWIPEVSWGSDKEMESNQ